MRAGKFRVVRFLFQGVWQMAVTSILFSPYKLNKDRLLQDDVAILTNLVMHEAAGANESKVKLAMTTFSRSINKILSSHLRVFEPPLFYEVTSTASTLEVDFLSLWTAQPVLKPKLNTIVDFIFRRIK